MLYEVITDVRNFSLFLLIHEIGKAFETLLDGNLHVLLDGVEKGAKGKIFRFE